MPARQVRARGGARRRNPLPPHPARRRGETVEEIELADNQQFLEEKVKAWLRARIKEIEEARAGGPT
ncbi:MAG TPA: hypothetical protein VF586_11265 [Pyrinomonadaceae bacterium]